MAMEAQASPSGGKGFWGGLRAGAWATAPRIRAYLRILAFANLLGLALAIARAQGIGLPQEAHFSTEFSSFYAAGRLVEDGAAAGVYAPGMPVHDFIRSLAVPPAHRAMEQAIQHDKRADYFAFFYPPVFWLVCAPLARLPYAGAYALWVGATGLLLAFCLRHLMGGWRLVWRALAFTAVVKNAGVGENAFLSAGVIGLGLLSLARRPGLAGACFGVLCYKPHFLLPVLIFLVLGRHWRALAACIACAAALCLLSALLFGWDNWVTYFTVTVPHAEFMFSHHGVAYALQVTPGSALHMLGAPGWLIPVVRAAGEVFALYALAATRHAPFNVRAAMLTASFPLLASVMLTYDLTICGLGILFLLREAEATGFLPWEKTLLGAMTALPLMAQLLRLQWHIPVDAGVPVLFMAALLRRAGVWASSAPAPGPPRPA